MICNIILDSPVLSLTYLYMSTKLDHIWISSHKSYYARNISDIRAYVVNQIEPDQYWDFL